MLADVHILYQSDFYEITDFKCLCTVCSVTKPEYNNSLCVSFIRKGFFEYRVFNGNHEAHIGRILVSMPGYEHTTRHIDNQPDASTVFEFKRSFFETLKEHYKSCAWFLKNNDIHSILLNCSTEADYMHQRILQCVQGKRASGLQIDEMVMELLDKIMSTLGHKPDVSSIPGTLIKYHLTTIEIARRYIHQHFSENISLKQLAQHCHTSTFHFSRIFKTILSMSPHQYLLGIRLQHAKILLSTTSKPVSDIAFECGFNSLEHFATAYRQQFKISPTKHRKQLA
jgi:AraC-like DNA-binding protein